MARRFPCDVSLLVYPNGQHKENVFSRLGISEGVWKEFSLFNVQNLIGARKYCYVTTARQNEYSWSQAAVFVFTTQPNYSYFAAPSSIYSSDSRPVSLSFCKTMIIGTKATTTEQRNNKS